MPFEVYFGTREIALRLDKSGRTVRRWIAGGLFGPGVVTVGGDVMVPQSGIEAFLSARRLDVSEVAAETRRQAMLRKLGRPCPASDRVLTGGVSARSPGELRRKLQEACA